MATPIVGISAKVTWTKTGGSLVTLKNQTWSINVKNMVGETSNTTDGKVRVIGLEDYDGEFTGFLDTTQKISTDIFPGDTGVLKLFQDATTFWQGTVIITDITEGSGTEEVDKYTVKFAKQSGALVKPV